LTLDKIRAYTTQEIKATGWVGDARILDLLTGISFTIRAPGVHDHIDFMSRSRADTALLRQAGGRSWDPRPGLLFFRGVDGKDHISAGSFHTVNHSVVTASPSDEIVSPRVTRETERDKNGNWVPGHHFCFTLINSRQNTAWEKRMYLCVLRALELANKPTVEEDDIMVPRYNDVKSMPLWAQDTVSSLIEKNIIQGRGEPDELGRPTMLDLSEDMLRMFVINDRAGLYGLRSCCEV